MGDGAGESSGSSTQKPPGSSDEDEDRTPQLGPGRESGPPFQLLFRGPGHPCLAAFPVATEREGQELDENRPAGHPLLLVPHGQWAWTGSHIELDAAQAALSTRQWDPVSMTQRSLGPCIGSWAGLRLLHPRGKDRPWYLLLPEEYKTQGPACLRSPAALPAQPLPLRGCVVLDHVQDHI
ncbi:hypothetical protein CB1_000243007 [Camelus ferus]|nr:hypothetical protein CB1_000243007 [Camelus ferus]